VRVSEFVVTLDDMSGSVAVVTEAWCRRNASAASALANDLRKERNLTGDGSLGSSINDFV